jgi:Fe-S cluster biogenesis protein NfuA
MTDANDDVTTTPAPDAQAADPTQTQRQLIDAVIEQIRPYLVRDGGDCELVDVSPDGKTVYLRLQGACSHCPSAIYTLKYGIEQVMREMVPGVEAVEAVP